MKIMLCFVKLVITLCAASLICGEADAEAVNDSRSIVGEDKDRPKETSLSAARIHQGRQLYKELLDKLFQDNSPMIPPNADDPTTPVNLTILMVVQSLAYLDMKSQTLNIIAWFQIDWNDPSFAWDTSVYPLDVIVVNEEDVWRPVLAIANSMLHRDQLMEVKLPVNVFSNGNFRSFPGDSFIMDCHINLNLYPFDVQKCTVNLTQWSHHNFVCTQAEIRSAFRGNGEWDITDLGYQYLVFQEDDYDYWVLVFTITLKRKWMFYGLNLILPIILVSALNNVVFMLPVECGDKMAVSVTTFLTLGVFLTIIQDSLAKNSDTVCYLTLYLAVQMTLGALAIVESAVVVACHHRSVSHDNSYTEESFQGKPTVDKKAFNSDVLIEENQYMIADYWSQSDNRQDNFQIIPDKQSRLRWSPDPRASQMNRRSGKKGGDPVDADDIGHKKSSSRDWTRIAAKIDSICFPVFVGLNIMSLFVFCIIIVSA